MSLMMLTVEGWSRELRKDRRVIARLLADVAPDATERGRRTWKLTTVLRALDADTGRAHNDAPPQNVSSAAVEEALANMLSGFEKLRRVRSIATRRTMFGEIAPLVGKFINALDADAVRDLPDQRAIFGIVRDYMQRTALGDLCDLIECDLTAEGLVARTHTTKGAR